MKKSTACWEDRRRCGERELQLSSNRINCIALIHEYFDLLVIFKPLLEQCLINHAAAVGKVRHHIPINAYVRTSTIARKSAVSNRAEMARARLWLEPGQAELG